MEISCRLAIFHAEYVISEKAVSFAFKVPTPPPLPPHPICQILAMLPPWLLLCVLAIICFLPPILPFAMLSLCSYVAQYFV